jgi:hypothetical protein
MYTNLPKKRGKYFSNTISMRRLMIHVVNVT